MMNRLLEKLLITCPACGRIVTPKKTTKRVKSVEQGIKVLRPVMIYECPRCGHTWLVDSPAGRHGRVSDT